MNIRKVYLHYFKKRKVPLGFCHFERKFSKQSQEFLHEFTFIYSLSQQQKNVNR